MADEILSSVLKPAAEEFGKFTLVKIKHLFTYLCFFDSNIRSLRDEAKKLEDARDGLQRVVEAAENNAEEILQPVKTWLENANNMIDVVKGGINDVIPNLKNGCWGVKSRFRLSRRAVKITGEMKQLMEERSKFDHISAPPLPPAQAEISSGTTHDFQSRKKIEEEIMEALKAKEVTTMGICGMGGVGKTTMAKRIMERVKKENMFQEIFMVVVSQPLEMLKIQGAIAESLGLKLGEETLLARATKLRTRLTDMKRKLIVLDDVWEKFKLEDLGIPSGNEQCTTLLTSRNKDVLETMDAQKILGVQILSETEAWDFFKKKVGPCVDDPNLLSTAESVARECKYLPLALITVGGALKGKTSTKIWEDALQQLKSSNPEDMPDVIRDVYNPLKLSYTYLENRNAKSLFLLCSLFPEDHEISLEELTIYCMGLRMFCNLGNSNTSERTLEKVRNRVFKIVDDLKNRFLLLSGRNENLVRMHDIVRDVAIYIASKEANEEIVDVKFNSMRSEYAYEWVSVSLRKTSSLLSMHATGRRFEIKDFALFEEMKELNVMSFNSIWLDLRSLEIEVLKNLRTLRLENCSLKSFSFVGELLSLEILYCNDCDGIEELPVEIGKLKQLKLFNFSRCRSLKRIPPGVISNLVELEELSVDGLQSLEVEVLKILRTLRLENCSLKSFSFVGELLSLEILYCNGCDGIEELPVEIGKLKQLKLFNFSRCRSLKRIPPGVISNLVELEVFKMLYCFRRWELAAAEVQGQERRNACLNEFGNLSKLTCLEIEIEDFNLAAEEIRFSRNIVKYFINIGKQTVHPFLGHDKYIHLELPSEINLASWVRGFISSAEDEDLSGDGSIALDPPQTQSTKALTLRECSTVKKVVNSTTESIHDDWSNYNVFPVLEHLWLRDLPNLEELYDGTVPDQSNSLQNLQRLELTDFPALRHLWKQRLSTNIVSLHKLSRIDIRNCNNLLNLFSFTTSNGISSQISTAPSVDDLLCTQKVHYPMLEYLSLDGIDKLEVIWNSQIPEGSNSFRNLTTLELSNLPAMTHLWKTPNVNGPFGNLSEIDITNCPNLRSLFQSIMSTNILLQFAELRISDCEMMEQVLLNEENENDGNQCRTIKFPKLSTLRLNSLGSLTGFGKRIDTIEFLMLKKMDIIHCPKLLSLLSSHQNNQILADGHSHDTFHLLCSQKVHFPMLESLRLDGLDKLEVICNAQILEESNSFMNLTTLELFNLPAMTHLWKTPNVNGPFSNLSKIEIENCHNLHSLFKSIMSTDTLLQFAELTISNCGMMEQVSSNEENENDGNQCYTIKFLKLSTLRLNSLGILTGFGKRIDTIEFPMLKKVDIIHCPKLFSLLSSNENNQILGDGHSHDTVHLFCSQKVSFGSLKKIRIGTVDKGNIWCHQISHVIFRQLEVLEIWECKDIKSLFSSSVVKNLVNLKELEIRECNEMVKVIEDDDEMVRGKTCELFPRLTELNLYSLPKLESFCNWRSDLRLPLLEEVWIERCPLLKQFSSMGSVAAPNLKDYEGKHMGDLNTVIQQHFNEKEEEDVFEM